MDAEHLILGAGCAGLSLAVRLAARPRRERGRILVVDARTGFDDDRTWCAFGPARHPFAGCVSHRWTRVRVRTDRLDVVRELPGRPYEQIPAAAFYREALDRLLGAEGVELHLGVRVQDPRPEGDGARAGPLRARIVWDARGGAPEDRGTPGDVRWLQHFVGWVVRTERPIFDPGIATLMDFRTPQDRGPHFVYVLPYAPDQALVEDTYFSAAPLPDESAYERGILGWLDRAGAGAHEILRRERGVIPMTTAPAPPPRGRVVPIGLRGGAAKPSTGYAFAFVQRHVGALAEVAGDGARPIPAIPVRSPVATFFDRIFLSYLRRHPTEAPETFGPLFARTPPERLVRFLSEEAGLRDHVAVMNGVPRLAVALEAVRARALWLRAAGA